MKWRVLLPAFVLASCSAKNTFVIDDPNRLVRTATLQICGSETPLVRSGDSLKLTQSITCEGNGEVRLIYHDGGAEDCPVGYVDSGAKQKWLFRAEQSACLQEKI